MTYARHSSRLGQFILLMLMTFGLTLTILLQRAAVIDPISDAIPQNASLSSAQPPDDSLLPKASTTSLSSQTLSSASLFPLSKSISTLLAKQPSNDKVISNFQDDSSLSVSPAEASSHLTRALIRPTLEQPSRTRHPTAVRYLLVDQDAQMMVVYENNVEVRRIPVSTGAPISNQFTPAWEGVVGRDWGGGAIGTEGFYTDQMWYLFAGAEGSILIHSLPYKLSDEKKVYDQPQALGVAPTSHGCVRISPEDAKWLQLWNPKQVPIKITEWSGPITLAENLLVPD